MGKNKNRCYVCNDKYYPPTGKNCKNAQRIDQEEITAGSSVIISKDVRDSPSSHVMAPKKSIKKSSSKSIAQE